MVVELGEAETHSLAALLSVAGKLAGITWDPWIDWRLEDQSLQKDF